MKKQILFGLFILSIGFSFFSCNMGEGGNNETVGGFPAVVDWKADYGGIVLGVPGDYIAAPSLTQYMGGECLFIESMYLDYDNQPTDKYITATNIVKTDVEQSYLTSRDKIDLDEFSLPISLASGWYNVYFNGKFFLGINSKDKTPSYRLIYNNKDEEADGVKNFYLQAKASSTTPNTSDVSAIHAFDMYSFIQYAGRDTTITHQGDQKVSYKYLKARLHYFYEMNNDKPVYKIANVNNTKEEPFELYLFK